MVKFKLFGSFKKKKPAVPLSRYVEVAKKMLEMGKTQGEVATFLKTKGLSYEQIDMVMHQVIKSATLSKPSSSSIQQSSQNPSTLSSSITSQHPSNMYSTNTNSQVSASSSYSGMSASTSLTEKQIAPSIESSSQFYDVEEQQNKDDEFLMELEEIVDLILKNKYGDVLGMKKEMEELRKKIKSFNKEFNEQIEQIKEKIEEIDINRINNYNELNKKFEELLPRMNALESAFKDNIPVMLDELRKIEEHLGIRDQIANKSREIVKKSEKKEEQNDKDESGDSKLDIDLGELMKEE